MRKLLKSPGSAMKRFRKKNSQTRLGVDYLVNFCGRGSLQRAKSKATTDKRNEVFRVWKILYSETHDEECPLYPPVLLIMEDRKATESVNWCSTMLKLAQLGPLGTECDLLVANSGKTNKNGKLKPVPSQPTHMQVPLHWFSNSRNMFV
jgi:hypothetical protein